MADGAHLVGVEVWKCGGVEVGVCDKVCERERWATLVGSDPVAS